MNEWLDTLNAYQELQHKNQQSVIQTILIDKRTSIPDLINLSEIIDWYHIFLEDKQQNYLDGHNFNIFKLLYQKCGFKISETMHSKLILFLIDPNESHGLGKTCLIELLKILEAEEPEKGHWTVTAEGDRIDILIKREYPESIIIIENKSNWAKDQNHQLYRYWYRTIYLRTKRSDADFYQKNKNRYQIVYLSPTQLKRYEEHSICKPPLDIYDGLPFKIPMEIKNYTFDDQIQKWLDRCKSKVPISNHRIREYITQYQYICKNL